MLKTIFRVIGAAFLHDFYGRRGTFFVTRLEPPLIALVLYVVQANLLGEMASERYFLSWLGAVVLLWTLRVLLRLDESVLIRGKISGVLDCPGMQASLARSGGAFVAFVIDLSIIAVVMAVWRSDIGALYWLAPIVFVIAAQGTANMTLFLFHLSVLRWWNLKAVLITVFAAFALMSPVMFMFYDLHEFGNRYFTSFNPASHFLAAYYNVLWYGEEPSFQVLPLFLVGSVLFMLLYCAFFEQHANQPTNAPHAEGKPERTISLGRFVERGPVTGLELFFNVYALGPHRMKKVLSRYRALSQIQEYADQFNRPLSTYSRMNDLYLDLLLAACLSDSSKTAVNLPEDEAFRVSEEDLANVLSRVNAIMGTNLTLSQ